jgi:hypothetical protein
MSRRVDGFIEQDARGIISARSPEAAQRRFGRRRGEAIAKHAAGMDGDPAKPIDQRSLFAVVEE